MIVTRLSLALCAFTFTLPAVADTTVTHNRGFELATEDGDYRLRLRAFVQPRFGLELGEEPGGDGITGLGFRVRRGRIYLQGNVFSPDFGFKLQADFTRSFPLLDWFVEYELPASLLLRAGQFKMPFSRQHLAASSGLGLVDRSSVVEAFTEKGSVGPDGAVLIQRDIGASIAWAAPEDLLTAEVGAFNGNGLNNMNDDTDLSYVLRLTLNPQGPVSDKEGADAHRDLHVSVGVNVAVTPLVGAGTPVTSGADLAVWAGPVFGSVELFHRVSGEGDAVVQDAGFHVQGGFLVLPEPSVEIAARYGWLDENLGTGAPVHEVTVGPNLYLDGHNLKVQLNYVGTFESGAAAEHAVVLQTTLGLK